jgi:DNA polymerase IV
MPESPAGRVILHLDMDAFYAAIETLDDPALAGKPVIVGHRGRRGVVSTCSYEARRFGVRSAMPSVTAERLCKDAIWVPVRMERYVEVSRRLRQVFEEATPMVEPLSIDEAFLDLTGVVREGRPVLTLEDGRRVARWLKDRIRGQEGLSCSVGVAPNKYLAKVASDLEKPDGLVLLPLDAVRERLWPLSVTRLWGVGPKTAARLEASGLRTIGDVARQPVARLAALAGEAWGPHLHDLAHGRDERVVDVSRAARSISEERTYTDDLTDPDTIDRALLERAEGVARELRREGLLARTVRLKVRTGDFTTWTRARTLAAPTDLTEAIVGAARDLYRERIRLGRRGVRLLGVGVDGLLPAVAPEGAPRQATQGGLFADAAEDRARRAARAADAVRERLGEGAITRARLLRRAAPATDSPSSGRIRDRKPAPARPTR